MAKQLSTELVDAFLEKARAKISDDPHDRLSIPTKEALVENNFVFDAHCHVFDGQCIDPTYFVIRTLGVTDKPLLKRLLLKLIDKILIGEPESLEKIDMDKLIESIYNRDTFEIEPDVQQFFSTVSKRLDSELYEEEFLGLDWNDLILRIKEVITILKTFSMEAIYENFRDKHSIQHVDVHKGKTLITVVLGMDIAPGWEGSIMKTYSDQTEELVQLATNHPILPFLPIDPRRFDNTTKDFNELWDTFLNAFEKGKPNFYGVKLYPSLGYLPSDERLQPILQICAEKNIPVTCHCGGEMVSTFKKKVKVNRFGIPDVIDEGSRKLNSRKLNEPIEWIKVLEKHPKLRLNLGHFGGVSAWKKDKHSTHHRIKTIIQMMNSKSGKVFTDFSFNLNDGRASENFVKVLNSNDSEERIVKERCMFGTDFWVVLPMSNLLKDQTHFTEITTGSHYALFKDNVLDFLGIRMNEL